MSESPYCRLVSLCDAFLQEHWGQPPPDSPSKDILADLQLTPSEKRQAALLALQKLGINI